MSRTQAIDMAAAYLAARLRLERQSGVCPIFQRYSVGGGVLARVATRMLKGAQVCTFKGMDEQHGCRVQDNFVCELCAIYSPRKPSRNNNSPLKRQPSIRTREW